MYNKLTTKSFWSFIEKHLLLIFTLFIIQSVCNTPLVQLVSHWTHISQLLTYYKWSTVVDARLNKYNQWDRRRNLGHQETLQTLQYLWISDNADTLDNKTTLASIKWNTIIPLKYNTDEASSYKYYYYVQCSLSAQQC